MNKFNGNNTRNGSIFLGVVLAVILLSVSGWGACVQRNSCLQSCSNTYCLNPGHGEQYCADAIASVSSQYGNLLASTDCPVCHSPVAELYYTTCGSKCEADSLKCDNAGGTWTNTGASTCDGKSCKVNHCKAADSTWLSTSIASCTGSNNYALVNTDSTCEHIGTCCPNDSIPSGNTCKWRCDSVLTTCNNRTGVLLGGVLQDTSVSGQDTTFSYQCYYNCSHSPNPDSTVYLVEGNVVLSGPNDSISDGIKSGTFNSVRTTTGGVYVYDYLSPSASEYIDSIAAMKCVEHLWRCVINNNYVYWYDNQEVPAGCTNIVRVK